MLDNQKFDPVQFLNLIQILNFEWKLGRFRVHLLRRFRPHRHLVPQPHLRPQFQPHPHLLSHRHLNSKFYFFPY